MTDQLQLPLTELDSLSLQTEMEATRAEGLARLASFTPRAGSVYARTRNFDFGPHLRSNVSVLSPYVRHRLVTEDEVVRAVLARHSFGAAEKFIQEVVWRTYWKGWLEQRPEVWARYLDDPVALRVTADASPRAAAALEAAVHGRTGIAPFDAWIEELVTTGYLHNHARMWFASIWIFTLGLPWRLGADLFLRHLLDGDAASNTLSWRWVAGLQTRGKTYLARPDNIARFTDGRFGHELDMLTREALPVEDADEPWSEARRSLQSLPAEAPSGPCVWVGSEDDLGIETWPIGAAKVEAVVMLDTSAAHPGAAAGVVQFKRGAIADATRRASQRFDVPVATLDVSLNEAGDQLRALVSGRTAIMLEMTVGHAAAAVAPLVATLEPCSLITLRRAWDAAFWPHATAGFFKVKERIPAIFDRLGLTG